MPFLYSILPPSQYLIIPNPVLYLSTGNSNVWTDSESTNDFTVYNSPAVSNSIYTFNGTTQYASINTFSPAFTNFSIMMWVKLSGLNTNQYLFSMNRTPTNVANEGIFNITPSNRVVFWDYNGTLFGFSSGVSNNTTLTTGVWYCIGFVKNGLNGTYYLNGLPDGNTTAALNVTYGTASYSIGKDVRDNGSLLSGQVGHVLLYNQSFTASQMLYNYRAIRVKF